MDTTTQEGPLTPREAMRAIHGRALDVVMPTASDEEYRAEVALAVEGADEHVASLRRQLAFAEEHAAKVRAAASRMVRP